MAKPVKHRFSPSTEQLKLLADEYLAHRVEKAQFVEASQPPSDRSYWHSVTVCERRMEEAKAALLQAVRSRLILLNKIPNSRKLTLHIGYVVTPWGDEYWEWWLEPVYMQPLPEKQPL